MAWKKPVQPKPGVAPQLGPIVVPAPAVEPAVTVAPPASVPAPAVTPGGGRISNPPAPQSIPPAPGVASLPAVPISEPPPAPISAPLPEPAPVSVPPSASDSLPPGFVSVPPGPMPSPASVFGASDLGPQIPRPPPLPTASSRSAELSLGVEKEIINGVRVSATQNGEEFELAISNNGVSSTAYLDNNSYHRFNATSEGHSYEVLVVSDHGRVYASAVKLDGNTSSFDLSEGQSGRIGDASVFYYTGNRVAQIFACSDSDSERIPISDAYVETGTLRVSIGSGDYYLKSSKTDDSVNVSSVAILSSTPVAVSVPSPVAPAPAAPVVAPAAPRPPSTIAPVPKPATPSPAPAATLDPHTGYTVVGPGAVTHVMSATSSVAASTASAAVASALGSSSKSVSFDEFVFGNYTLGRNERTDVMNGSVKFCSIEYDGTVVKFFKPNGSLAGSARPGFSSSITIGNKKISVNLTEQVGNTVEFTNVDITEAPSQPLYDPKRLTPNTPTIITYLTIFGGLVGGVIADAVTTAHALEGVAVMVVFHLLSGFKKE